MIAEWVKTESDKWKFAKSTSNPLIIRSTDDLIMKNCDLVFDFICCMDIDGMMTQEMSCGWAVMPCSDLEKSNGNLTLELKGG